MFKEENPARGLGQRARSTDGDRQRGEALWSAGFTREAWDSASEADRKALLNQAFRALIAAYTADWPAATRPKLDFEVVPSLGALGGSSAQVVGKGAVATAKCRVVLDAGLLHGSPEDAIDTLAHEARHVVDDVARKSGQPFVVGGAAQKEFLDRGDRDYNSASDVYLANPLETNANQSGHDVSQGWLKAGGFPPEGTPDP